MEKSGFTTFLVRYNHLDGRGFCKWVFLPGMGFGETQKWWDSGRRPTPHEGLDLCFFLDRWKNTRRLNTGDAIPVIHDGTVKALIKDFLGQTVIVAHDLFDARGENPLITLYAHTLPDPDIHMGKPVAQGDIIARIADSDRLPTGMMPHVHISAGRMKNGNSYDQLDWVNISRRETMVLMDPLALIDVNL